MSPVLSTLFFLSIGADPTIAVLPMTKGAGSEEYAGLGKALSGMITTDLSEVEGLQLVERERLNDLLAEIKLSKSGFVNKKTAQKLGKGLGAQYLVSGSYSVIKDKFLMDARVVAVQTGKIAKAANANGTVEDFVSVEKALVEHLLSGLRVRLTSSAKRKMMVRAPTESFDAFKAYGEGIDAADRGKAGAAKEAFQRALKLDPEFEQARAALGSLSNLLAEERLKSRKAARAVQGAAHKAILAEYPDERKRKRGFEDTFESNLGFALRLVALENEDQHCQRFEEMRHFLNRRKWRLPEWDRKMERAAKEASERFKYEKLAEGPRSFLDERLDDRIDIMRDLQRFTVGYWLRPDPNIGEGIMGSLRRCFPAEEQNAMINKLIKDARKAGMLNYAPKHGQNFTIGESLELSWAWTQAKRFGATRELAKRTKKLLKGREAKDPIRAKILKELEEIEKAAKQWDSHKVKRLGISDEEVESLVIAVANDNKKVVKTKTPICKHLVRQIRGQLKTQARTLKKEKRWDSKQYTLDTVMMFLSPLKDMGCLKGQRARFKDPMQLLKWAQTVEDRMAKGAAENDQCLTWSATFEFYKGDQYVDMFKNNPTNANAMAYGILMTRYNLLANECVRD